MDVKLIGLPIFNIIKMKVSIIIPSYNRGIILPKTLDSICAQTYQDWECIIVDDHSTDNTKDVVARFVEKEPRFHYMLNERKKGAQGARNTGLYHCQSEWVFFFDSDNIMHPNCLAELVSKIDIHLDVIQCFSKVIDVETGETGRSFKWRNYGNIQNRIFNGTTYVDFNHAIIRKTKILGIGGLDEDCPSMQEWDTHIRLSKCAQYYTIEKVLVDYFVGAEDAISTDNSRAINGRLYIMEKYLKDWRKHLFAYWRFAFLINELIKVNQVSLFKESCNKKLRTLVPNFKISIFLGYFFNKYFGLINKFYF